MCTIKHRAETPITPEKGDTLPTAISNEIFQQRGAIVACKMNSSPLIGIFDILQAEDSLEGGCLPQQWSLETHIKIK